MILRLCHFMLQIRKQFNILMGDSKDLLSLKFQSGDTAIYEARLYIEGLDL